MIYLLKPIEADQLIQTIFTCNSAYHGHLTAVMEISPYKFNKPGGDPKPDYVHVVSTTKLPLCSVV